MAWERFTWQFMPCQAPARNGVDSGCSFIVGRAKACLDFIVEHIASAESGTIQAPELQICQNKHLRNFNIVNTTFRLINSRSMIFAQRYHLMSAAVRRTPVGMSARA
jgi:hypothetical protein